MGRPGIAAARRRGDCRCSPAGTRGDRTPSMVSCPLLTPLTFLRDAQRSFASKRGLRGLGSVRRFAQGTLYCPEFTLRKAPRITVRGHSVQGDSVPLRKAPLRSRIVPWSTKRTCGPLAFRRATEGSRGRGKMWGRQEGDKKPGGCLGPLLSPPPDGGSPAVGTAFPCRRRRPLRTPSEGVKPPPPAAPLYRREDIPSVEGKEERASALDKGF